MLAAGRGPRRRSQAGGQPPGVANAAEQPAATPMKGASEHFHFLSVLAGGPALVFFAASIRAAGQCFLWPRRGFPLVAVGSLSIFAIETLLAARRRTSKLVGRAATQLNANSKSSPSR